MKNYRLTRRDSERLLDHEVAPDSSELSRLLSVAARPSGGRPTGENVAMAQFRESRHLTPSSADRRRPLVALLARKALAAPVVAVGAAGLLLGGGGLAFTAATGHVPFTGHDNRSDKAPAAPSSTNPGQTRAASNSPSVKPSSSPGSSSTGKATPAGTPSPSIHGLCRAYKSGALQPNKKSPAFAALTKAAGGSDSVTTYCASVLAAPKPTPAVTPTKPSHPTHPAKPTQAATPTKPAKPTQAGVPATPTKPAKPSQAATPTKPTQAAR